jgi:hypothetical protein
MTALRSFVPILALAMVGCGGLEPQYPQPTEARNFAVSRAKGLDRTSDASAPMAPAAQEATKLAATDGAVAALAAIQPATTSAPTGGSAIARKIIYDGQVDLIVASVDPIAQKVGSLVRDARGYIAEQSVTGSPGSQRSMRWRFRIPVEQFDAFTSAIVALGELERNNRTSQDVTEQYYDIEARIKNKRVEEQTLNKILQERSGKLEDVLKIEIELSRVRGEIEQLEGKIRVLENLSSLATLTLNIREREKYAPPPPTVADCPTQIARTWDAATLNLVNHGKSLVLWTVSWVLWVPFLLVGLLLGWTVLRWLVRVLMRNLPRLLALARTPIIPPRAPTASH